MSIRLMSAVTKYGPKNSSHRFVLLMIADNAADDGSNAFPAVETLADKTALSERTVVRALNALVKEGYLIRTRRQNTSNLYQIVLSKLQPSGSVSDKLSLTVNDTVSLTEVTPCHVPGCHDVTYAGDTMSPDPSFLSTNDPPMNRGRGTPARAAVAYAQFDRTPGPNGKGYKLPDSPPVSPPAAQLMQRLTGRYPGAGNVGYIAERLGESPDEEALAYVVKTWQARGHNPSNYEGICDWYDERVRNPQWIPARNGSGKQQAAQPAAMKEVSPGLF